MIDLGRVYYNRFVFSLNGNVVAESNDLDIVPSIGEEIVLGNSIYKISRVVTNPTENTVFYHMKEVV